MEKDYNLKLNASTVNTLLGALGEIPLKNALDAYVQIRSQIDQQNQSGPVEEQTSGKPQLLNE